MTTYNTQKKTWPCAFASLLMLVSLQAMAKDPVYTSFFSNVALSGYDTVAYFSEGKAVAGNSKFATEYRQVQWYFKNAENLATFKASPDKYAPQYGGYCAWAVAHGDTAKGDPQQWTIHNGKLYLNYDAGIQSKWLQDKDALIEAADTHWPGVLR